MKAKRKPKPNRVAERIESLVGEAYEIGHDHGGNTLRMALGQPLHNLDKGWWPISKKLQRLFKKHER